MVHLSRIGASRPAAAAPLRPQPETPGSPPARGRTRSRLTAPLGWLAGLLLTLGMAAPAAAQLTGTQTIPSGTYPTIASAIAALNNATTGGVGAGGVTFNVTAGHTETMASVAAGRLNITVNLPILGRPIIFQKSGGGANPKVTASSTASTTTVDAIISLNGTDYVTFNGIDLFDPAANNTQATAMEAGYALFRPTATDGCQNNTIQNCVVTLNRSNIGTGANGNVFGIYGANSTSASSTAIVTTATTGANSNNRFYSNTVLNTQIGIFLSGSADATSPYTFLDQSNDVGGTAASTGNTIQNFGGYAGQANGVKLSYQNNASVRYNTIDNAASTGVASPSTIYGINQNNGANATGTYSNNTITLTQAANASQVCGIAASQPGSSATTTSVVTASNNVFTLAGTTSTGTFYGLLLNGTYASEVVSSNTLSGTVGTPMVVNTTGSLYFINASNNTPNQTITNNTSNYVSKTGAGGTFYGYYNFGNPGTGTATITGNTISNITLTGATSFEGIDQRTTATQTQVFGTNTVGPVALGTGTAYGIYTGYGPTTPTSTFDNNTVTGLTGGGSTVYGFYLTSFGTATATGNTITNISSSGSVYGAYITSGTTGTFTQGNINTLSSSGATAYGVLCLLGHDDQRNQHQDLRAVGERGGRVRVRSVPGGRCHQHAHQQPDRQPDRPGVYERPRGSRRVRGRRHHQQPLLQTRST